MTVFISISRQQIAVVLLAVLSFMINVPALAQSISCSAIFNNAFSKDTDGLLPIYQMKENGPYILGIPKNDPATNYLFATYIDRGVSPYIGDYIETSVVRFEEVGNTVRLIETFGNLTYGEDSPLARTRQSSLSDTRLTQFSKLSCVDDTFFYAVLAPTSLRPLGIPAINRMRRAIGSYYPNSIEVTVQSLNTYTDNINLTVDFYLPTGREIRGAASAGGFTTRISHSIMRLPDENFRTRLADPTVGYFTANQSDLSKLSLRTDSEFINRWRLVKKDPSAALSDPVKPIVFWIENTTPFAFRDPIRDGVLAWNEAFKAAGFTNAVEVKTQPDDAEWSAGDINYNVIRWEASPFTRSRIGYGPSITDPRTGEILAADILLNFSGIANRVGHWLTLSNYTWEDRSPSQDNVAYLNANPNQQANAFGTNAQTSPEDFALNTHDKIKPLRLRKTPQQTQLLDIVKFGGIIADLNAKSPPVKHGAGKIRSPLQRIQDRIRPTPARVSKEDTDSNENLSNRMVNELITSLTMHEVGHTLGLMHNFTGSRYRAYEDIHDADKTNGIISGSVMDYVPINFAPPGVTQGDFANTRVGPYDVWAIKFGYDPALNDSDQQRAAVLRQADAPGHHFSTYYADPYVLTDDLSDNPTAYALDVLRLANGLINEAEEWSARESATINAEILSQILQLRAQALSSILSQLWPIRFDVDQSFEKPAQSQASSNRIVKTFVDRADQESALKALEEGFFASNDWSVPPNLNRRLGEFSTAPVSMDGGRSIFVEFVLQNLLSSGLIMEIQSAREQGGNAIPVEDYLKRVREMVFGQDLGLAGNPSPARRSQQYTYVTMLTSVLAQTRSTQQYSVGYSNLQNLTARRQLQNEVDAIRRELFLPYFWASEETKLHRQELKDMLP